MATRVKHKKTGKTFVCLGKTTSTEGDKFYRIGSLNETWWAPAKEYEKINEN